jgi:hypothetical protein
MTSEILHDIEALIALGALLFVTLQWDTIWRAFGGKARGDRAGA